MLALDLITSHLFGDYVVQFGPIPARKLTDWRIRLLHVAVYTVCFIPTAILETRSPSRLLVFASALAACHFVTDSRRFGSGEKWAPRPIIVDQSLHLLQLAVLSRILTGASEGRGIVISASLFAFMLCLYVVYGIYERRRSSMG